MFTGIVHHLGKIISTKLEEGHLNLGLESELPDECFVRGSSIAVDGVCLTVERYDPLLKRFWVTAIQETLDRTTLGALLLGSTVHLEAPCTPSTFLGGHLVSGHVDAPALVLQTGEHFALKLPKELMKYCPTKGSIAVWGVSLTIASSHDDVVEMALIPETLAHTKLGALKVGDLVHVEVDVLARTLEHLYASR